MSTVCKHKLLHHHRLSQFFQCTALPHEISGQVYSSHSIVSSSRTVRPCSPWEGRWIGHWKTTMVNGLISCATLTSCRSGHTPFVQTGQKRPTPVWRWLSRTQAVCGVARNFVQGGSMTCCTSDCSFRLFPNNSKLV